MAPDVFSQYENGSTRTNGSPITSQKSNPQGDSFSAYDPFVKSVNERQKTTANQGRSTAPVVISKPKVGKAAQAVDTIKNTDLRQLGESFKSGVKSLPGMAKTGAGILLQNWSDYTKQEVEKRLPKQLKGKSSESPIIQKMEGKAKQLKETGFQEQRVVREEYAQKVKPGNSYQAFVNSLAFNTPQILSSTGLSVATALVTKNPALATTIGLSTSYGLNANEVYNDARGAGIDEKTSQKLSTLGGILMAPLDIIPLENLIGKAVSAQTVRKSLIKFISSGVVDVAVQGGLEGVTEGSQEIIANAIARTYNKNRKLLGGVTEAALSGAIFGGLIGGGVAGINNIMAGPTDKISEALSTPQEKRTEPQKELVKSLLVKSMTPDQAMSLVVDNKIEKSEIGKKIVKYAAQAWRENKNVSISPDGEDSYRIEVVSPEAVSEKPADKPLPEPIKQELEVSETKKPIQAKTELLVSHEGAPDAKTVEQYKADIQAGKEIEPIKVIREGEKYGIEDGKHRYQAYKELGYKEVPVEIVDAPKKAPKPKGVVAVEAKKKAVKVGREQLPVGEGDKKVSRLAQRMTSTLESVDEKTIEELPSYSQINKKEQIQKAAEYVSKNQTEALEVLKGNMEPPKGILYNSIALAMREQAKDTGDLGLITNLASLRSTRYGQEISILTEADPHDPVNLLKQVRDIRIEAIERRTKKPANKAIKEEVAKIKKQIKKPDKYDWSNFIESIKC